MILLTSGIYCSIIDNRRRGIKHCYCYPWQSIFSQGDVINCRGSDRQRDAAARMCARARTLVNMASRSRTHDPSIRGSIDQTECARARTQGRVRAGRPRSLLSPARTAAALSSDQRDGAGRRGGEKKPFVLSAPRNYPDGESANCAYRYSAFPFFFRCFIARSWLGAGRERGNSRP